MALRRSAVRIRYAPCKKAPISGAFLHGAILGLLPLPRCGKYAMGSHAAAQAKLPTAVRQLGQTRSVCPAGASRRGVADGAAASQQPVTYPGRLTHPRHPLGCLFAWSNSGVSRPLPCCGRCMSSPVHRAPAGPEAVVEHTRKPGLRGRSLRRSPLGSRAPRGEDTSEPVPRQRRGRVGPSGH